MKKQLLMLLIAIFCFTANAQYTKLFDFAGTTNGSYPFGSLISDGTFLYGMTYAGGANDSGTVFKIMPDGTGYSKLLDFAGISNGTKPWGALLSDGVFLYGMTETGGTSNKGVIFKIMPDGTGYAKLLDFTGTANGSNPDGSLFSDGTFLYGLTQNGGTNNKGTLFKIMPDGTAYSKLLDFTGTANGANPFGSLISDGTFLYGMTGLGGTNNLGTIFKIMPDGTNYTKLLDFAGSTNGSIPTTSLIYDGTFLYGTASQGGTNSDGVIFKIMPDGTNYTKLFDFSFTNGYYPQCALISDGTFLYGTTLYGGTNDDGVIFKIMPDGTSFSKLMEFAGTNGNYLHCTLISDGTFLYGMTNQGGANNMGVIFKYALPTGIKKKTGADNDISVFPNPFGNVIEIKNVKTGELVLSDITEKEILRQNILADETKINTEKISPGFYLLNYIKENKTINIKLVKF